MKHIRGKRIRFMSVFGYKFEIYENVVVLFDNEDPAKNIEMQHHTFEKFLRFYKEAPCQAE